MMKRETFLELFEAAQAAQRDDYARRLATDWLSTWPGDAEVARGLVELEIGKKRYGTAIDRLQTLIVRDPEDREAYQLLSQALKASGEPARAEVFAACGRALAGQEPPAREAPDWTAPLARAVKALSQGNPSRASTAAQEAMLADANLPLPAWIATRALLALEEHEAALGQARAILDRWPESTAFRLLLADLMIRRDETGRGVEYLHRCVSGDPTGSLAARILGPDHPYKQIWPEALTADPSRPIPADVQDVRGGNQLGGSARRQTSATEDEESAAAVKRITTAQDAEQPKAGEETDPDPDDQELPTPLPGEAFDGPDPGDARPGNGPDALQEVREEFRRLAQRFEVTETDDGDKRAPIYVVLTSRTRLTQELGEDGYRRVREAAESLTQAVRRRKGWGAHLMMVDDPNSMKPFGLSPVDPGNAWQIKLRLADLDSALAERGQMIGALLIVGGHRVIPFHMLPNPTDDEDDEVPSDNPYATTDENYFAPEWPVGRIPADGDTDLLSKKLRGAAEEHRLAGTSTGSSSRLRAWLTAHFGRYFGLGSDSLGYTASIWKKASLAVFRSIGDPGTLMSSPPVEAQSLPSVALKPTTLSYYNLHGLEDSPEWYGQRDPFRDTDVNREFPVALRIKDVVNSGRAPKIVFTEACYGAHVIGKTSDTALALRFLDAGSHAVIGSTKISYGSVTPPLIAADLLGRRFWDNLNRQLPVGEALRRAKLQLVSEMHKRQGYLDGEDQKALISFVLYGDPLYAPRQAADASQQKTVARRKSRPKAMRTACAKGRPSMTPEELDGEARERVRTIVSRYLPGMSGATCSIHTQHHGCDAGDHTCPSHQLGMKGLPQHGDEPLVVTLSRRIPSGEREHPHYARLTLDSSGKVLKLAVSR